jgi:4-hydroxybenzoate polyprenyltransferase
MSSATMSMRSLSIYLEMIKFQHSVFALPFALSGMIFAAQGWPNGSTVVWILVAMVSCRSAAMAYNRIIDRDVDALNPRTSMRALPAGQLKLSQAMLFFLSSCVIFLFSAAMLNTLALMLSPVALFVTLFYSKTKRFTPLSHFFLGLSLGIAPGAAWIGVRGTLDWQIVPLCFAVLFWTAGFDIIYSLQDEDFDKRNGLRSLTETYGKHRALQISRFCHVISVALIVFSGFALNAGVWYYFGAFIIALLLTYEQSLVKPHDLSRVNMAFFTLNGFVSIGFFVFVVLNQILG